MPTMTSLSIARTPSVQVGPVCFSLLVMMCCIINVCVGGSPTASPTPSTLSPTFGPVLSAAPTTSYPTITRDADGEYCDIKRPCCTTFELVGDREYVSLNGREFLQYVNLSAVHGYHGTEYYEQYWMVTNVSLAQYYTSGGYFNTTVPTNPRIMWGETVRHSWPMGGCIPHTPIDCNKEYYFSCYRGSAPPTAAPTTSLPTATPSAFPTARTPIPIRCTVSSCSDRNAVANGVYSTSNTTRFEYVYERDSLSPLYLQRVNNQYWYISNTTLDEFDTYGGYYDIRWAPQFSGRVITSTNANRIRYSATCNVHTPNGCQFGYNCVVQCDTLSPTHAPTLLPTELSLSPQSSAPSSSPHTTAPTQIPIFMPTQHVTLSPTMTRAPSIVSPTSPPSLAPQSNSLKPKIRCIFAGDYNALTDADLRVCRERGRAEVKARSPNLVVDAVLVEAGSIKLTFVLNEDSDQSDINGLYTSLTDEPFTLDLSTGNTTVIAVTNSLDDPTIPTTETIATTSEAVTVSTTSDPNTDTSASESSLATSVAIGASVGVVALFIVVIVVIVVVLRANRDRKKLEPLSTPVDENSTPRTSGVSDDSTI
eukprot:m.99436 g.99436  ORF g.99436 m.99436 type:complete len:592 (+) comp27160_c0_seq1:82-1857(+)